MAVATYSPEEAAETFLEFKLFGLGVLRRRNLVGEVVRGGRAA